MALNCHVASSSLFLMISGDSVVNTPQSRPAYSAGKGSNLILFICKVCLKFQVGRSYSCSPHTNHPQLKLPTRPDSSSQSLNSSQIWTLKLVLVDVIVLIVVVFVFVFFVVVAFFIIVFALSCCHCCCLQYHCLRCFCCHFCCRCLHFCCLCCHCTNTHARKLTAWRDICLYMKSGNLESNPL